MSNPRLIIAGISLPRESALQLDQTYDGIMAGTRTRLGDGSMFGMRRWGPKWKTTLSGKGWIPAPLLAIDYSVPFELQCIRPITLLDGQSLPDGWTARADVDIKTRVIDGMNVRFVWPVLQVWADPPSLVPGIDPSWELSCEEA